MIEKGEEDNDFGTLSDQTEISDFVNTIRSHSAGPLVRRHNGIKF